MVMHFKNLIRIMECAILQYALEALQHGRLALDAIVRDVADLITVEYLPFLAIVVP